MNQLSSDSRSKNTSGFILISSAVVKRIPSIQATSHEEIPDILNKTYESGYGDVWSGSKSLLARVSEICPRLCLFGHVHPMYGTISQNGTTFVNAALMREDGSLNPPILLDSSALYANNAGLSIPVQV